MANRAKDWLAQARRDLQFAGHAAGGGFHEWACFAAPQAGEKAVRALCQAANGEARGHAIVLMLQALSERLTIPDELLDVGRRLDRFCIPTRYPHGFDLGAPKDYFTEADARSAIDDADQIITFCSGHIS